MSLSNRNRRLSVAPMARLERRGRGSRGGGGSPGRISHSFPEGSHFIRGAHPFFGLLPQFHPGQSFGAGSGVAAPEGSYRVGSTSFSRLLQPSFCGDESLRVLAAGNRPFTIKSQSVKDTIQDGDYPVHSVVSLQRGLDGLHRPQRRISTGSNPPGFQEVSEIHGLQQGLNSRSFASACPRLFTRVMAPVSTILHTLGIRLRRYLDDWLIQVSSREQVLLSLRTVLQLSGNCRQLGEVTAGSDTENLLPGSPIGLGQFQGFSSPETCRQAALNWRRVSILRGAACKILAGVARSAFLTNPAHSGGTAADAVVSVSSSSSLGSEGSKCSGSVVSGDRAEPPLVVRSRTPRARRLPSASVSPARLVVRRLGCRPGSSPRRPGRFRPLVAGRSSRFHQPAGASSHLLCAPAFSTSGPQHLCGRVLRQHDCSGLPEESGRYQVGSIEPDSPRTPPVDGAPLCNAPSSIHCGPQQRLGGLPVSAESNSGLRMDTENACVPSSSAAVACSYRSVCNISESPLHTIFFSLPRSQLNRDRCSSPTVEWVAGVCLSSLCADSSGAKEAPLVLWGADDDHSSLLAPEAVVSGALGVGGGRSSGSASGQGSVDPASFSSAASGSVKASSSCMETTQRFVKVGGFSRHVAKQTALARKPSSRAGYQAKWLVYRRWCTTEGHSISRPLLPKIADFLFWLRRSRKLSVSAVIGYRSMLSAVFRSVLPEISTSAVLHDLLRSFRVEVPIRSVSPPAWNLLAVLEFLKSPIFEPLRQASLRDLTRKTLFLIALASAKRVSELQALSRTVAFSSSAAAVVYVPEFLAKTESALRSLPRSFDIPSLSDFAAGLPDEMLLCPVRTLSEYIARTSSVTNRPRRLFVSPRNPSWAMSKNGISFLLREVIVHSGASPNDAAAPRAHSISGIATSSAFFRNWSLSSVLEAASWRSNTVFTSFYFKDVQYILDNVHSLGPFVAAGARLA